MDWIALDGIMVKRYKPKSAGDWSGILWHNNGTTLPSDLNLCGWQGELCGDQHDINGMIMVVVAMVVCILCLVLMACVGVGIKRYKFEIAIKNVGDLIVNWSDIILPQDSNAMVYDTKVAELHGKKVTLELIGKTILSTHDRNVLVDIKEMNDLQHENINSFIGICMEYPDAAILMVYEQRETLMDILANTDIKLDLDFKLSLLNDIVNGMRYLHYKSVGAHGRLTSFRCVVDGRWICKVTGHGLSCIRERANQFSASTDSSQMLWTAPELLRQTKPQPSKLADVYSFSIIMFEVITRQTPFFDTIMSDESIIEHLCRGIQPVLRPTIDRLLCPTDWLKVVNMCWEEDPLCRPSFSNILEYFIIINHGKPMNLVDNMITRLEQHTRYLEDLVGDRTKDLQIEKEKVDSLIGELLPKSVVDMLKQGKQIAPETFTSVTIFFSDIVGFTRIASNASPLQIIVMLNDMYGLFDDITRQFDVYKIATIGDAYMVASGVPIRNGHNHATEICNLSLALLSSIRQFAIPHNPNKRVMMRIGVHSGPCVAGVAGIKMPRYMLFGDTVDIAAKMESSGETMKVQISETTHALLMNDTKSPFYFTRTSTDVFVKGHRLYTTYWLDKCEIEELD